MERNHRNYSEGAVLSDLGKAGVKIRQIVIKLGDTQTNNPANSKVIIISKKAQLGIKRLGKIDFLLNSCKGYLRVEKED